jgi:hypothetical protein
VKLKRSTGTDSSCTEPKSVIAKHTVIHETWIVRLSSFDS